jgi:hypothetical protein
MHKEHRKLSKRREQIFVYFCCLLRSTDYKYDGTNIGPKSNGERHHSFPHNLV